MAKAPSLWEEAVQRGDREPRTQRTRKLSSAWRVCWRKRMQHRGMPLCMRSQWKRTLHSLLGRWTKGVEPCAVKAACTVLNGEREETGGGPRLALTQPGFRQQVSASVRPLKKHMTKFTELLKGNLVDYAIEYRVHATCRMFQRHIGAEEVAFILSHGQVIEHYDEDFPLPSVLLNGRTAANRPLHVVVGINVDEQKLVIITTYEPDTLQWADNFSRRIV